jgi:hypothetical protein
MKLNFLDILAAFCADPLLNNLFTGSSCMFTTRHLTNTLLSLGSYLEEYPGVIVEVDENGDEFKRPTFNWADYFHKNPGAKGMTKGENMVSEFWVRYLRST